MASIHLLDSGPLGLLAHDRPAHRLPLQNWVTQTLAQGDIIYLPEVADYEVRRELTRLIQAGQLPPSRLNRLDQLVRLITYLPVSTAMSIRLTVASLYRPPLPVTMIPAVVTSLH